MVYIYIFVVVETSQLSVVEETLSLSTKLLAVNVKQLSIDQGGVAEITYYR